MDQFLLIAPRGPIEAWPKMHYIPFPGTFCSPALWDKLALDRFFQPAEASSILRSYRQFDHNCGLARSGARAFSQPRSAKFLSLPPELFQLIADPLDDIDLICLGSVCSQLFASVLQIIRTESIPPSPPAWALQPLYCMSSKVTKLSRRSSRSSRSNSPSNSPTSTHFTWPSCGKISEYYGSRELISLMFRREASAWSGYFQDLVHESESPERPELNYWTRIVGGLQGDYECEEACHKRPDRCPHRRVFNNGPGFKLFRRCFGGSTWCVNAKQIWLLRCHDMKEFITCCSCRQFKKHVKPASAFDPKSNQSTGAADKISINEIVCLQTMHGEDTASNPANGRWAGCRLDIVTLDAHQEVGDDSEQSMWTDITENALADAVARKAEAASWQRLTLDGQDGCAFPGCGCLNCRGFPRKRVT